MIVLPPNAPAPYPFQLEDAERTASQRGTLLSLPCGAGKTGIAIMAASILQPKHVLVVCPAGLRLSWAGEIVTWSALTGEIQVVRKKSDPWEGKRWTVVSYDMLSEFLIQAPYDWDYVIADEGHYLKNPKAARTAAYMATSGVTDVILTATPILNKPSDLWSIVRRLDPGATGKDWWGFMTRFCGAKYVDQWMKIRGKATKKKILKTDGLSNPDELKLALSRFMIRRLKSDILPFLPPKVHQIIRILPNATLAKKIKKTATAFATELEALGDAPDVFATVDFTKYSAARKEEGVAKVKAVLEHLADVDGPTIVFAWHTEVIKSLLSGLDYSKPAAIMGGQSNEVRQENIRRFQDGETDFIVCQIKAGGVGVNLQRAENVVFAEIPVVPADIEQCVDRAHRIGSTGDKILIYYLVWEGSLDARICELVREKLTVIQEILG